MEIKNAIRSISLFTHLENKDIDLIASLSTISTYDQDTTLFYESEMTENLLFLVDGLIKIYKMDKFRNEIFLYYIHPNSMISEISNLNTDKISCCSNSKFLKKSILLSIDFKKFKDKFLYKNELILRFMNELIYKNHQLQSILNRELVFDATSKVAFMLINNLEAFNSLKRIEASLLLHIQPETLSRVLKKFMKEGIVYIKDKNVFINKQEELKKYI